MATTFARKLADAFAAHDAEKAGALFARDAVSTLVGDAAEVRGRAAIEHRFRAIFARYQDARLAIGRLWVGSSASVIAARACLDSSNRRQARRSNRRRRR